MMAGFYNGHLWLERTNPTGEPGRFVCKFCNKEGAVAEMLDDNCPVVYTSQHMEDALLGSVEEKGERK